MGSESEFPHVFQDFVRKVGAPQALFSDNAKAETSKKVKQILRHLMIDDMQSEPHHQHQNPAERHIQEVKKLTNRLLDRTGAPKSMWLLCALFVVSLLNVLAQESLGWQSPTYKAFARLPDISPYLAFYWWEPVYYLDHNAGGFPSTKERLGRIVGVSENCGDLMTWQVLDVETLRVTDHSELRSARTSIFPNLRAEANMQLAGGEKTVTSFSELVAVGDPSNSKLPKFSPHELVGISLLKETDDG